MPGVLEERRLVGGRCDAGERAGLAVGDLAGTKGVIDQRYLRESIRDAQVLAGGGTAPADAPRQAFGERAWPPLGFAKAYQQLMEEVPSSGRAFTPHDYDLLVITLESGIERRRPALEWPVDLPRPPIDLNPAACHYNESDDLDPEGGCRFMLSPSDNRAVARFDRAMRSGGHLQAVSVNGIEVAVRFHETYRGERTIDAMTTCAEVLASRNKNPVP